MRVDITGKRFGKLTAKYSEPGRGGNTKWICECDCGRQKKVELGHLKSGATKSCGQCSRIKYDLSGQKFGRLTVLKLSPKRNASRNAYWLCKCSCGNFTEVDSYQLRHGGIKSCGCLKREAAAKQIKSNPQTSKNIGNTRFFKDENGNDIQRFKPSSRNKSGVIGVSFNKSAKLWVASMMVKGKLVLSETYPEFQDAVDARKRAERQYLNK
jgi:hypothetical protein